MVSFQVCYSFVLLFTVLAVPQPDPEDLHIHLHGLDKALSAAGEGGRRQGESEKKNISDEAPKNRLFPGDTEYGQDYGDFDDSDYPTSNIYDYHRNKNFGTWHCKCGEPLDKKICKRNCKKAKNCKWKNKKCVVKGCPRRYERKGFERCCSEKYKCKNKEGDCNLDSQCYSGLICGNNNCHKNKLLPFQKKAPKSMDCCTPDFKMKVVDNICEPFFHVVDKDSNLRLSWEEFRKRNKYKRWSKLKKSKFKRNLVYKRKEHKDYEIYQKLRCDIGGNCDELGVDQTAWRMRYCYESVGL